MNDELLRELVDECRATRLLHAKTLQALVRVHAVSCSIQGIVASLKVEPGEDPQRVFADVKSQTERTYTELNERLESWLIEHGIMDEPPPADAEYWDRLPPERS